MVDHSLFAPYTPPLGHFDEIGLAGGGHPHWQNLIASLQGLGVDGLRARHQVLQDLLHEGGVTYNVYSDPRGTERAWPLDPVPMLIDSHEWADIELGLTQRAELFNALLIDLYGPQRTLHDGILPADLVFGYSGFLRPCMGSLPVIPQVLTLYAADLVRGADGKLQVLADRTQAPSGSGYALENRLQLSRAMPSLFRDAQAHRLTRYFQAMRQALVSLAPEQEERAPRMVLLSPGPLNEAWFEHVFLARYLGLTVVQGQDLVVSQGRVWLKSLSGPEPVDVILRRVDDAFCDPLALRQDSWLGVAGLLEAARQGQVAIANPLGTGVLECPGIRAYMPQLSEYLLGRPLRLPTVPTRWCGDPQAMNEVLADLSAWVIRSLHPQRGRTPLFPARLSVDERDELVRQMRARPGDYVAQQAVDLSVIPAMSQSGQLEPRRMSLRSFVCAREGTYQVMPGGLTRVAHAPDAYMVSNQLGGVSKDTWVLSSEPEPPGTAAPGLPLPGGLGMPTSLPARVAENLFWMGRYAERTEGGIRMMRLVLRRRRLTQESGDADEALLLASLLPLMTQLTATFPGFADANQPSQDVTAELVDVIANPERMGGISFNLNALLKAGYALRDRVSGDSWRVVSALRERARGLQRVESSDPEALAPLMDEVITHLLALSGIAQESIARNMGWAFLEAGRRIERAGLLMTLLRHAFGRDAPTHLAERGVEPVLAFAESLPLFRTAQANGSDASRALQLLLRDESNPRGLPFQLRALQVAVMALPADFAESQASLLQRLKVIQDSTAESGAIWQKRIQNPWILDDWLVTQGQELERIASQLSEVYFAFPRTRHLLMEDSSEWVS